MKIVMFIVTLLYIYLGFRTVFLFDHKSLLVLLGMTVIYLVLIKLEKVHIKRNL